ncbi:MFS transporter [Spongiactinospora sp. TRM90649]|uniref:MFS transporter n=1 Tax=Spongiactinospora sp. TRM90649 TaxID=3031114 RepID=UPI0023F7BD75|nr:MFS transporter [Spongiactinospora sp. TRM90649]MDF5752152.1 MFS transporter [Spongiactinospora sp. TRM90649]
MSDTIDQSSVPGDRPGPSGAVTIAARLDRLPVGRWHRRLTLIIGGGLFYEYFELVLGGTLAATLRPLWNLTPFESGVLISSVFLGMFVGAVGLGYLGDRFGRRRMFLINLTIYLVFGLLAAAAPNVWVLAACRFVAGIGAGAESTLVGAYIGEFMPRASRGRYLGWVMAIAFAAYPTVAFLGAPLAGATFLIEGWRWLLIAAGSGAVLLLWVRRSLPESARWLIARGRHAEADAIVAGIEREAERESGPLPAPAAEPARPPAPQAPVRAMFRGRYLGRLVVINIFNVCAGLAHYGIGAIAPIILLAKGFDIIQSLLYTGLIAIGYPLGAAVVAIIADRVERKRLIVVSALLMAVVGIAFGVADQETLVLLTGFAFTALGSVFATAACVYVPEIFPTETRGFATGLGNGLSRLATALMPFAALAILAALGPVGVLGVSALLLVICAVDIGLFGPRTTGRQLEAVTAPLAHGPAS